MVRWCWPGRSGTEVGRRRSRWFRWSWARGCVEDCLRRRWSPPNSVRVAVSGRQRPRRCPAVLTTRWSAPVAVRWVGSSLQWRRLTSLPTRRRLCELNAAGCVLQQLPPVAVDCVRASRRRSTDHRGPDRCCQRQPAAACSRWPPVGRGDPRLIAVHCRLRGSPAPSVRQGS